MNVNETASATEETSISDDERVGLIPLTNIPSTNSLSSSDPSQCCAYPSNDIVSCYLNGIIFTLFISKTFYLQSQIDVIQLLEKNDSRKELIAYRNPSIVLENHLT